MSETVVISDLHGQADRFKDVVSYYGDDVHYVINGDVFDRGPDTKELMQVIGSIGHTLLLGNHEWAVLGALTDTDALAREAWQKKYFTKFGRAQYEMNVLSSYGIDSCDSMEDKAQALHETLQQLGHLALLQSAKIYYEDDDIFVVHAGLDAGPHMSHAYKHLDEAQLMHDTHTYTDLPQEIGSFTYAGSYNRPPGMNKLLITGHDHIKRNSADRLYYGRTIKPQRAFLASFLDIEAPLYAYESATGKIREFLAD